MRKLPTSAAIVRVDRDVVVGEVAGPDRGAGRADADIGADDDLAALHIGRNRILHVLGGTLAVAGDDVRAEPDREPVAVGGFAGLSYRHDDAAPVGVLAENG